MSDKSLTFSSLNMPKLKDSDDTLAVRKFANDVVTALNQLGSAITASTETATLSGNEITPLPNQVSGNTTYLVPSTPGYYQVYIPSAYLLATTGGPFTLSLATSANAGTVLVPISNPANSMAISSGDLIFNIKVDSSGNVKSGYWVIGGSNANGSYIMFDDGTMECRKYFGLTASGTQITFPIAFIARPDSCLTQAEASGAGGYDNAQPYTITASGFYYSCTVTTTGAQESKGFNYIAIGRWRT